GPAVLVVFGQARLTADHHVAVCEPDDTRASAVAADFVGPTGVATRSTVLAALLEVHAAVVAAGVSTRAAATAARLVHRVRAHAVAAKLSCIAANPVATGHARFTRGTAVALAGPIGAGLTRVAALP